MGRNVSVFLPLCRARPSSWTRQDQPRNPQIGDKEDRADERVEPHRNPEIGRIRRAFDPASSLERGVAPSQAKEAERPRDHNKHLEWVDKELHKERPSELNRRYRYGDKKKYRDPHHRSQCTSQIFCLRKPGGICRTIRVLRQKWRSHPRLWMQTDIRRGQCLEFPKN